MKIEAVWTCPVCGESAMGLYEGSDEAKDVLAWVQEGHRKINPECPYRFKSIEVQPMRDQKPEEE